MGYRAITLCLFLFGSGCGDDTTGTPPLNRPDESLPGDRSPSQGNRGSAAPAVPEEREEASRFSTDGFAPVRRDMDSGAQMASGDDMESQPVTSGSAVALPAEWRGHWTSRFTTGLSECAPCALGTSDRETALNSRARARATDRQPKAVVS